MKKYIKIFDINFIDANFKNIKSILDKGGLLVLPSGPGLATIKSDFRYYKALKNADLVLFDSGYFCLLLRFLKNINVQKFSGFKFLKIFLKEFNKKKQKRIYLVEPSTYLQKINKEYLKKNNINNIYQYVAPIYKKNKIYDNKLLKNIKKIKPKYIIINLGGGTQEVLGLYLKQNLNYKPSIICSGAAISFLTNQQAPLTNLLDNLYISWLVRIFFDPKQFLPRYLSAFKLFFLVLNEKIK
jgi:UDP-N-acetyl-D-mannosaminuronic acid transferase (WecB/TagA/CpsF family)